MQKLIFSGTYRHYQYGNLLLKNRAVRFIKDTRIF